MRCPHLDDVADVRDAGLRGAADSAVAARAASESRVLVAGDTDFANSLRFPPGRHPGILVLRLPNAWSPEQRATRRIEALDRALLDRLAGCIVIVEPARVRILTPR